MGACIAFSSECEGTVDPRFTSCCDDVIEEITMDADGFRRLINDLEILSTSMYATASELLLKDT